MLQLNSKNIPYQSVQVFLSLVSKSSDIANTLRLLLKVPILGLKMTPLTLGKRERL